MSKAKLNDVKIGKEILNKYLESNSDFSFELKILNLLKEKGINCTHGGHYTDPITGKSREFDIRATKICGDYGIKLSVECKNIRENFPVLISTLPRSKEESFHEIAMLNSGEGNIGFPNPAMAPRAKIIKLSGEDSIYREGAKVGKSIAQVGTVRQGEISSNDSEIYEKWGQCLSSANDLVKESYFDSESMTFVSVLPIVVIPNERLWIASYNSDGELTSEPKQTNRCSLFIDRNYSMGNEFVHKEMSLSHIEIMTVKGFEDFIENTLNHDLEKHKLFSDQGIWKSIK